MELGQDGRLEGAIVDLHQELKALKEQAGLSAADILRVGLEKCAPLADEAFHNGFMVALAGLIEDVRVDCEDLVMALVPDTVTTAPFP